MRFRRTLFLGIVTAVCYGAVFWNSGIPVALAVMAFVGMGYIIGYNAASMDADDAQVDEEWQ